MRGKRLTKLKQESRRKVGEPILGQKSPNEYAALRGIALDQLRVDLAVLFYGIVQSMVDVDIILYSNICLLNAGSKHCSPNVIARSTNERQKTKTKEFL